MLKFVFHRNVGHEFPLRSYTPTDEGVDRTVRDWDVERDSARRRPSIPPDPNIKLLEGLGAKNNHKCVSC